MEISGRLCCVAAFCLALPFIIWHALEQGGPGILLDSGVCSQAEVREHCADPWKNLTFIGTGTREECKVLHYGPGQDKPCCYHDERDGFAATDVCDPNPVSLADQKACRTGTRKPEFKIEGIHCTMSIPDPDSRDVGRYEGSMPPTSMPPHIKHVDYNDVCANTVELSCKVKWWLILFACCTPVVVAVVAAVPLLYKFREKIFPCCYQPADEDQEHAEDEEREEVQI